MNNETNSNQINTFFDAYSPSDITQSNRIINTPSEFAKDHLFYIQEAGYLKSLKSHISQREQLSSFLFLIVLSGSGQFTYRGKSHQLHVGSCILINCNHHYSHQSSEVDPWELMWVHFNGKNILSYMTYFESIIPEVVFHTEIITDFTTIIKNCIDLEKKNDITSEFILSKMITDLMTLCITRKKDDTGRNGIEKMNLIKDYIDDHFQNKLSLAVIAQEFFISKYYLAREFKNFYGMTIGDYIISRRVTYSKELLRFTKKTIEDISILCGIPDTNYYAKVFRRVEECSPSEYRKKW